MNENGKTFRADALSEREWHLISDHQYILMKKYIYTGMRKQTILYKDLVEQELLEIWCGDWADNAERKKVLTCFGTRILYEKARAAFEKDLLSR